MKNILPYRFKVEELEQLLQMLNQNLKLSVVEVKESDPKGFVEYPDGTRYAIITFYGKKVTDLKKLKGALVDFTNKLINKLDRTKILYIGKNISVWYVPPSHLDVSTFDYVENPSEGYWIPYCRLRQPGHEIQPREI